MMVVMNRIPVKPEHWDAFEKRFLDRAGLVDSSPGFIRNWVLRPAKGTSDYHVVMTLWENREAFEAWTRSDAFIQAHKRARETPREIYNGPNVFEMFEVVSDTGTA